MTKNPIEVAHDRIYEKMSDHEMDLLRIITGKTDKDVLLDHFFDNLINFKAVDKFPIWEKLTINEKKQMIELPIRYWFSVIGGMSQDFEERCSYYKEEDLKFKIKVKGLDLKNEFEIEDYLTLLNEKYLKAFDEKDSKDYKEWLKVLIDNTESRLKKIKQNNTRLVNGKNIKSKKLEFSDLFFNPKKAEDVDKILEDYNYTKNGEWISVGAMKKIATAFYVLRDFEFDICIIKPGKNAPQLRTWCCHYGKDIKDQIRNLTEQPKYDKEKKSDYVDFKDLFSKLKEKK